MTFSSLSPYKELPCRRPGYEPLYLKTLTPSKCFVFVSSPGTREKWEGPYPGHKRRGSHSIQGGSPTISSPSAVLLGFVLEEISVGA